MRQSFLRLLAFAAVATATLPGAATAQNDEFCAGFEAGFRASRGDSTVVLPACPADDPALGPTLGGFERGIRAGQRAAARGPGTSRFQHSPLYDPGTTRDLLGTIARGGGAIGPRSVARDIEAARHRRALERRLDRRDSAFQEELDRRQRAFEEKLERQQRAFERKLEEDDRRQQREQQRALEQGNEPDYQAGCNDVGRILTPSALEEFALSHGIPIPDSPSYDPIEVKGWGAILCYEAGDYPNALKWAQESADQGAPDGQEVLGLLYHEGQGVPQDYAEAAKWYRRAAEQGEAVAQRNLGFLYANGQGVPQDDAEAVKWFRLAAEQSNARAQHNLGAMYNTGQGVPQDYAEAAKWFRLAAEQGIPESKLILGLMYDLGRGVPQDFVRAHMWYNLAAATLPPGDDREMAVEERDEVAGRMTPEQIAEAQRLAREWRPKTNE